MLAAPGFVCAAPHLKIECLDGTDYQSALSAVARMEVDGDMLRLVGQNGDVLAEKGLYNEVKKVLFFEDGGTESGIEEIAAENGIAIYPNPTSDVLTVSGIGAGETVRVFTTDGRLVMTAQADSDGNGMLQVSSLNEGVYLLQAGMQIVKFIKE